MHRTLYLQWDGDSYEIEVNDFDILGIWRYANNQTRRPEFCRLEKLDEELRNEIDNKVLKAHGEPSE